MAQVADQRRETSPVAASGHFPGFDGLRAIAAIAVLITHVSFSGGANVASFLGVFFARMDAGVAIFFLISGFLLYRPFVRARLRDAPQPETRSYLWRRVLRIYPAYWLALIFVVVVFQTTTVHGLSSWLEFLTLTHVYDSRNVFGPLVQSWTLAVEVSFYVFLPVYAFVLRRLPAPDHRSRVRSEVAGIAVLAVIAQIWKLVVLLGDIGATGQLRTWLPWWFDLFGAGMLLAVVSVLVTEHGMRTPAGFDRPWAPGISWALALLAFWTVSTQVGLPTGEIKYTTGQQFAMHYLYGLTAFFLLLPAVFGPQDRGWVRRFLQTRVMVYLGVISYGLYLWHELWIDRFLDWSNIGFFTAYNGTKPFSIGASNIVSLNWLWMLAVVFAMTLVSASISWYVLEKPVLRLKSLPDRLRARSDGGAPRPPLAGGLGSGPASGLVAPTDAAPTDAAPTAAPSAPAVSPDGAARRRRPRRRQWRTPKADPWWTPRRFFVALGVVGAAALAWRVVTVFAIATHNPGGGDAWYYHTQANLLADGHGFASPFVWRETGRFVASATHPPLYPLLLSVTSVFGGDTFLWHKLVSCVIGTAAVVVIGLVGRHVAGPRAGLVAAVLAGAYPNLWAIDGILMSEGLYALTAAISVLCAYRLWQKPTAGRALALGAAIGAATLARSESLALVVLLAVPVVLVLRAVDVRRRLALLGLVAATAAVVIAPWVVRNLTAFDRPVVLSTNQGDVLAQTNCDDTYDGPFVGFWSLDCQLRVRPQPTGDEAEKASFWQRRGLQYMREHRGELVTRVVWFRVGRIWEIYRPYQNAEFARIEGRTKDVGLAGLYGYWIVLPFAIAGAVVLRRRHEVPLSPLLALPVLVTLVVAATYAVARFRAPAEVTMLVLAGVAVDAALDAGWRALRRHRPAALPR